jgi:phospholipid/cholesterol/gamma-HCH transport system substrate-binding protein
MARSRKHEIGVGCLLVTALAVLGVMAVEVGALDAWGSKVHVHVAFGDVNGLIEGAPVAVAGVRIGTVEDLIVDHDRAIARPAIASDAGIRRDARARVRSRSMLGEKYVAVEPTSRDAPLARNGDELASAGEMVEIDDMVEQIGPVLGSMDPEVVRAAMQALSRSLEEDPERLARILANADRLLANGAAASEQLPEVLDETRGTLREARVALRDVDATARQVQPILAHADAVLGDLDEVGDDLPRLVADIDGLVGETREVVVKMDGASGDLELVLQNLSEIDKEEIRRLIREEGVLVRLRPIKGDGSDRADDRPRKGGK